MPRSPERVPRFGPARRHDRTPMSAARRLMTLRWTIVGVWAALLVTRVVVIAAAPHADLSWFGFVELAAIALGVTVIVVAVFRAAALRRRQADDSLALAVRRIDPTVWLVPAAPTAELREAVAEVRPEVTLSEHVTWAFGATEASLWELEGRRATRLLVVRWSRVVHIALEDAHGPRGHDACAVAIHYVRPDDAPAVATFLVRSAPGSRRFLGRGPRLDRLVADLARERIVA